MMMKTLITAAATLASAAAVAQSPTGPGAACPAGTRYATIRDTAIKDGKWATFESAVTDHTAWYARHGNTTKTYIARVVSRAANKPAVSSTEAVTVTVYANQPQPTRDAAFTAFTAKYRDSSTIKNEARVCLPAFN